MTKFKILTFLLLVGLTASISGQENGSYYFTKTVNYGFEEATQKVKDAFKEQGFGIITEIDMDEKLNEKLPDANVQPYKLLGICNPKFAYETIQLEENIGLFLPCKALVKYIDQNTTEIVVVSPSALMNMLGNDGLMEIADKVTSNFKKALQNIE